MGVVYLYFDGACLPINPGGVAVCGIVIETDDRTLMVDGVVLADSGGSTNQAEWFGLIYGLNKLVEMGLHRYKVVVYGDSQLVVRQFNGEYAVRASKLIPLYTKAMELARYFSDLQVKWVPREKNRADVVSHTVYADYVENGNRIKALAQFPAYEVIREDIDVRDGMVLDTRAVVSRRSSEHGRSDRAGNSWRYDIDFVAVKCNCPHYQKLNTPFLVQKAGLTLRCKHFFVAQLAGIFHSMMDRIKMADVILSEGQWRRVSSIKHKGPGKKFRGFVAFKHGNWQTVWRCWIVAEANTVYSMELEVHRSRVRSRAHDGTSKDRLVVLSSPVELEDMPFDGATIEEYFQQLSAPMWCNPC